MKTLNQLVNDYTRHVKQGEIQTAYRAIAAYIGNLRAAFIKKYPRCDISGLYQGYMDMTYFSFSTESLKEKGLKIAIVYLHEKGAFEAWLCARNRDIAKSYESVFSGTGLIDSFLFHDDDNKDAIVECTLTSAPDFENWDSLTDCIEQGVEKFVLAITGDGTRVRV